MCIAAARGWVRVGAAHNVPCSHTSGRTDSHGHLHEAKWLLQTDAPSPGIALPEDQDVNSTIEGAHCDCCICAVQPLH